MAGLAATRLPSELALALPAIAGLRCGGTAATLHARYLCRGWQRKLVCQPDARTAEHKQLHNDKGGPDSALTAEAQGHGWSKRTKLEKEKIKRRCLIVHT